MKNSICWIALCVCLSAAPLPVNAQRLAAGGKYTCFITREGEAKCWGENGTLQLGSMPSAAFSSYPAKVALSSDGSELKQLRSIDVFDYHSCATSVDNTAYCWGQNFYGELGHGKESGNRLPDQVLSDNGHSILQNVSEISVGNRATCAIVGDSLKCWGAFTKDSFGNDVISYFPQTLSGVSGPSILSIQHDYWNGLYPYSCVLDTVGGISCWGVNNQGQFGNGTSDWTFEPTLTTGLVRHAIKLSSNDQTTCAVVNRTPDLEGEAMCWGEGDTGELGNGSLASSLSPTPVLQPDGSSSLVNIRSISVGYMFACAVSADGLVLCWGNNFYGTLGNSSTANSALPMYVSDPSDDSRILTDVVEVSAGFRHACALLKDESVVCWGDNARGELGNGSTKNSLVPVKVNFDGIFASQFD